jgi:hypothetical protein
MASFKHVEGTMDLWATGPMKNERKSFEALFKFCCKSMKANNYSLEYNLIASKVIQYTC